MVRECPFCHQSFGKKTIRIHFNQSHYTETFSCNQCDSAFLTAHSRDQHARDKIHSFPRNLQLTRNLQKYSTLASLGRDYHRVDMHPGSRKQELDKYYREKVVPAKEDIKQSKATIKGKLQNLLLEVRQQDGGNIYNPSVQGAGSSSTNTKVNYADEFDFELPLNVNRFNVSYNATKYGFQEGKSLEIRKPIMNKYSFIIESGYVQVQPTNGNVPLDLMHNGYLVPRKIQEDLYWKLKSKVASTGLSLSTRPHGPALTLNFSKSGQHHINVDLVPSLYTHDIKVSADVWKRSFFRTLRGKIVAQQLKEIPILLVPKKENAWLVSYEKLSKEMINHLDVAGTCRKMCHKILKYDFLKWKSEQNFEGISTYPLKHHLLWFNDKHPEDSYWSSSNVNRCYTDMLADLATKLRIGSIPNYFNPTSNQLEGKEISVLRRLANKLDEQCRELKCYHLQGLIIKSDHATKLRIGSIPNYFNPTSNQLEGKEISVLSRLANKMDERCRELKWYK